MKNHVLQKALESEQASCEAEAFAKQAKALAVEALKRVLNGYKLQRAVLGDPASIAALDAEIASLDEEIRQMEE